MLSAPFSIPPIELHPAVLELQPSSRVETTSSQSPIPNGTITLNTIPMIRPQGLRRAAAALPPSSSIASRTLSSTTPTQADPQWPLLKKRASPPNQQDTIHSGGTSLIESLKNRQPQTPSAADPASSPASLDTTSPKPDSRLMLILHGLSPHLNASDFYRLAPSDLSSWQSVIKKATTESHDPRAPRPLSHIILHLHSGNILPRPPPPPAQTRPLQNPVPGRPLGELHAETPDVARGRGPGRGIRNVHGNLRDAADRGRAETTRIRGQQVGAEAGRRRGRPRPRGEAAGGAGPRVPPDADGRRPGRAHCRGRPVEGLRVEGVSAAGAAGRAGGASYGQGIIPREFPRRRRAAAHAAGY
ncbi:hypothetical protein MHUMG1_04622 [Metarhizium humberi]|uniref:Uncharacterized protein n=1 Tax=Metarhizium humberi TaxID=2596975 RepID=A0A9P8MBG3_9HYPO|nr:hypothetical protein MHUMG1_04622 [Metarhizium humberi]